MKDARMVVVVTLRWGGAHSSQRQRERGMGEELKEEERGKLKKKIWAKFQRLN